MDYYQTMRNDCIHKAMYPEDPMRVDWIPKGPTVQSGTLTIRPKEFCSPRFVTRIEGSAVEESARCKEYISIKNTKQNLLVFIPPTFTLESRNKNYSAPIGSMVNYLLSTESFM